MPHPRRRSCTPTRCWGSSAPGRRPAPPAAASTRRSRSAPSVPHQTASSVLLPLCSRDLSWALLNEVLPLLPLPQTGEGMSDEEWLDCPPLRPSSGHILIVRAPGAQGIVQPLLPNRYPSTFSTNTLKCRRIVQPLLPNRYPSTFST